MISEFIKYYYNQYIMITMGNQLFRLEHDLIIYYVSQLIPNLCDEYNKQVYISKKKEKQ